MRRTFKNGDLQAVERLGPDSKPTGELDVYVCGQQVGSMYPPGPGDRVITVALVRWCMPTVDEHLERLGGCSTVG